MPWITRAGWLFWVLLALGCEARVPEGRFACDTAEDCPSTWYCRDDNLCYSTPTAVCQPTSCDVLGYECGVHPDGCAGKTESCGSCSVTTPFCVDGICGTNTCQAMITCPANRCGFISDGCGGVIDCRMCAEPRECGAGGAAPTYCGCPPDASEPNNTIYNPEDLEFSEQGEVSFNDYSLNRSDDRDWFKIKVGAEGNNGKQKFSAWLDGIPDGNAYQLALGIRCEGEDSNGDCAIKSGATELPGGSCTQTYTSEGEKSDAPQATIACSGDATVYLLVNVAQWEESCQPYELTLKRE
ncbi:MAG: hypothetical protein H6714_03375 [Myxococcales bacterium]|nr:hypothetical protein [Myxococcales bacterium]